MALKRENHRGITLIEMVIYFFLSATALAVITALVTVARRTGEHTYAQYLVAGNMATTIRYIRKELEGTALGSVTSYGNQGGEPGFSCVSAYGDDGKFELGSYGAPHWQKHVYYKVNQDGRLRRWATEISDKNYLPTLAPESSAGDKVLLPDALPPNTEVKGFHEANSFGGLEVGFVRRKGGVDSISYDNPRDSNEPEENTGLVEVVLRTIEDGPNFTEVRFRVAPRY